MLLCYTLKHNVLIIGGHQTTVAKIKELIDGNLKFVTDPNRQGRIKKYNLNNIDIVWIQAKYTSHGLTGPIINFCKKNNILVKFFKQKSAAKCVDEIIEADKNINKMES